MEEKKYNALAITSLVLSLVGLLVFGIPCGIGAIITGIIGLIKCNKANQKGKGMAIAGISVGAVDVVMVLIWTIIRTATIIAQ